MKAGQKDKAKVAARVTPQAVAKPAGSFDSIAKRTGVG